MSSSLLRVALLAAPTVILALSGTAVDVSGYENPTLALAMFALAAAYSIAVVVGVVIWWMRKRKHTKEAVAESVNSEIALFRSRAQHAPKLHHESAGGIGIGAYDTDGNSIHTSEEGFPGTAFGELPLTVDVGGRFRLYRQRHNEHRDSDPNRGWTIIWQCTISDVVFVNHGASRVVCRAWLNADFRYFSVNERPESDPLIVIEADRPWRGDFTFWMGLRMPTREEGHTPFNVLQGTLDLVLAEVGSDREFRVPFNVRPWNVPPLARTSEG